MQRLPSYTVIRDTREQQDHGWIFEPEEKVGGKCQILGTKIEKLDAGDYSVVGLEDKVVIERKNGFGELFTNMTPKANKVRFENEMARMVNIPHKYILIESCLNKDILTLGIPQHSYGPPCSKVMEWLIELGLNYNIHVMFTGDAGKRVARRIFAQAARMYL
ncbi:MAG: ERCC4 domain-containing protein [Clostridia bacterium]|jgi:hypothetical protein